MWRLPPLLAGYHVHPTRRIVYSVSFSWNLQGSFRGCATWVQLGQTVKNRNRNRLLYSLSVSLCFPLSSCRLGRRYSTHLPAPLARCNGVGGHGARLFGGHFGSMLRGFWTELGGVLARCWGENYQCKKSQNLDLLPFTYLDLGSLFAEWDIWVGVWGGFGRYFEGKTNQNNQNNSQNFLRNF